MDKVCSQSAKWTWNRVLGPGYDHEGRVCTGRAEYAQGRQMPWQGGTVGMHPWIYSLVWKDLTSYILHPWIHSVVWKYKMIQPKVLNINPSPSELLWLITFCILEISIKTDSIGEILCLHRSYPGKGGGTDIVGFVANPYYSFQPQCTEDDIVLTCHQCIIAGALARWVGRGGAVRV